MNMTGDREPYGRVSSYDTELFGTPVAAIGAPELAREWSCSDGLREGAGHAVGVADGRVVAALLIGETPVTIGELTERIEREAAGS